MLEVWKKKINVLIHNLQRAPVTWEFTHVDFYAITSWEKVLTKIHLEFVWESEAKRLWGLIEEHIKEIEVKCLSENLVDSFEVDLSLLKEFWDMIKVSDLAIDSEKYDVITHEDDLVVIASKPLVYKEEEIAPAVSDDEEENSEDPK